MSVQPVASASRGRGPVRVGPDAWEWLTAADRSGRVGGHFRGGLNAVFGSEALVCLQAPSVPLHPWALVADLPWEEIKEGTPVTASRGELPVGPFVLSLAQAEVVDLTFRPPEHLVSLEELQERVALIEQLLAGTPDPFEGEFDRAFVRDRDRILTEWRETGDPAVLLDLIGRGPGTTPAGDDTLIGLLAGLEVLAAVAPALGFHLLQATRHLLLACSRFPTSLLSSQLLTAAAAGQFPSDLLELQAALLEGRPTARLANRARTALTVGQTTGRAVLTGLVAASLGPARRRSGTGDASFQDPTFRAEPTVEMSDVSPTARRMAAGNPEASPLPRSPRRIRDQPYRVDSAVIVAPRVTQRELKQARLSGPVTSKGGGLKVLRRLLYLDMVF